jgi:anti-sigma regulatory factor (Ser/Thr protein kinase)
MTLAAEPPRSDSLYCRHTRAFRGVRASNIEAREWLEAEVRSHYGRRLDRCYEGFLHGLTTAVGEAVNNAILHGCQGGLGQPEAPQRWFEVALAMDQNEITVLVLNTPLPNSCGWSRLALAEAEARKKRAAVTADSADLASTLLRLECGDDDKPTVSAGLGLPLMHSLADYVRLIDTNAQAGSWMSFGLRPEK